uniref:Uncharacterized protein n=1 Tax=Anguilla anguilla TaxID=7936 RepID=A0A0E9W4A5_ANGAN
MWDKSTESRVRGLHYKSLLEHLFHCTLFFFLERNVTSPPECAFGLRRTFRLTS